MTLTSVSFSIEYFYIYSSDKFVLGTEFLDKIVIETGWVIA